MLLAAAVSLRLWEELCSRALHSLMATFLTATTSVLRDGAATIVDIKDVVPGDLVTLSAGDLIPGDIRVLESRNLCIRCGCSPMWYYHSSRSYRSVGSSR